MQILGVVTGVALSVLLLVYRSSQPHCAILGRIPGTKVYRSITAWPQAITTPGVVAFRFDGALFFGNAGYLTNAVQVCFYFKL